MSVHNRKKSAQAFGWAVLIEALVLVGAGVLLVHTDATKPARSEPVTITLTDIPAPEKPPEPVKPPPPQPQPKIKSVAKVALPKPLAAPTLPVEAQPVAAVPTELAATPTAFAQPAPPPPPAPPQPSGKSDAQLTYAAKVNGAVQTAHTRNYPQAATMSRFSGQTQIEFRLRDGVLIGEPKVTSSCGTGIFDRASVQAVQIAQYPKPPEELSGKDLVYKVWIEFIGR